MRTVEHKMPEQLIKKLDREATKRGISRAELLRTICFNYFEDKYSEREQMDFQISKVCPVTEAEINSKVDQLKSDIRVKLRNLKDERKRIKGSAAVSHKKEKLADLDKKIEQKRKELHSVGKNEG